MNSLDLEYELEAACFGLPVVDARVTLVRQGVPLGTLRTWPPVGFTTIELTGETFQPAPHGTPAHIYGVPARTSADLREPGWHLVDLLAVPVATPELMVPRLGLARALGEENISPAIALNEPLQVHQTALQWLQSGRIGVVPLDGTDLYDLLGFVPQVVAQNPDHGRLLERGLRPPPTPRPEVYVFADAVQEARHG
jgi:hypothetical protein